MPIKHSKLKFYRMHSRIVGKKNKKILKQGVALGDVVLRKTLEIPQIFRFFLGVLVNASWDLRELQRRKLVKRREEDFYEASVS